MNMQEKITKARELDHIGIDHILFDHSEWVTLWGFVLKKGRKINKDYLISFEQFNELLRLSGEEGEQIQMLMVEKMESGIEEPSIIHLKEMIGHSAFFNRCSLKITPTWTDPKDGERKQTNCLFIENVYPPKGNKPKNLPKHAQLRQSLLSCETELATAYQLYLDYIELDLNDEDALSLAELEDDLKFKIAYLAWELQ